MLRHSNGEAVHFGGDVVALEKDEMFKRVYVHGEYSMYFSPPAFFFFFFFTKNAFEGCRFAVEGREE